MNNIFSKNNAKLIVILVSVFIAVSIVVAALYYFVCKVTGTATTGSDVANIFVASATLLGPIILVFTLNAWKDQHNKNLRNKTTEAIIDNLRQLLKIYVSFENRIFNRLEFSILSFEKEEIQRLKEKLLSYYDVRSTCALLSQEFRNVNVDKQEIYKQFIEHLERLDEIMNEVKELFIAYEHAKDCTIGNYIKNTDRPHVGKNFSYLLNSLLRELLV